MQQLLASIWYAGLPGFRRKNIVLQTLEVFKIGLLFPPLSLIYILAPSSYVGKMMRTPFIKFICHSASYFLFLCKYGYDFVIVSCKRVSAFDSIRLVATSRCGSDF